VAYTWSESAGRYRGNRGHFVSERTVRDVVDGIADAASARMAQASERLLNGEMSLGTWQAEMQATIKLAHVSAAILAHGGAEQMSFSRWGAIGPTVRDQYGFLREFAAQVADGRQPMNGSLPARAKQYGQAARTQFERVRGEGQQERGYQFERNVLSSAEHCSECRAQTARGLVPIGTLVPVGQRICRSNCRCSIWYSRDAVEAA
jgi:hypothetical protein